MTFFALFAVSATAIAPIDGSKVSDASGNGNQQPECSDRQDVRDSSFHNEFEVKNEAGKRADFMSYV